MCKGRNEEYNAFLRKKILPRVLGSTTRNIVTFKKIKES